MPKGHELDMGSLLPYTLDEFAIQRDPDAYADLGVGDGRGGRRAQPVDPGRAHAAQRAVLERRPAHGDRGRHLAQGAGRRQLVDLQGRRRVARPRPRSVADARRRTLWLDKKTRKSEDYSDVWNLSQKIDAPPSAAQKEWMYQNINIPEVINYMAINSVIRHNDSGWYNWFIARDTEGTGRWELWHWDLDYTFTTPARDGKGTFLTPDTSNKLTQAVLAYPDWKEMFIRRLRTLADQFLPAPKFENQWDAITAPYAADWKLDIGKWGGLTAGRGAQPPARRARRPAQRDRQQHRRGQAGAGVADRPSRTW